MAKKCVYCDGTIRGSEQHYKLTEDDGTLLGYAHVECYEEENPTKREAKKIAEGIRAKGRRARVMPAGGKGNYEVFIDGERMVVKKGRKVKAVVTVKKKPKEKKVVVQVEKPKSKTVDEIEVTTPAPEKVEAKVESAITEAVKEAEKTEAKTGKELSKSELAEILSGMLEKKLGEEGAEENPIPLAVPVAMTVASAGAEYLRKRKERRGKEAEENPSTRYVNARLGGEQVREFKWIEGIKVSDLYEFWNQLPEDKFEVYISFYENEEDEAPWVVTRYEDWFNIPREFEKMKLDAYVRSINRDEWMTYIYLDVYPHQELAKTKKKDAGENPAKAELREAIKESLLARLESNEAEENPDNKKEWIVTIDDGVVKTTENIRAMSLQDAWKKAVQKARDIDWGEDAGIVCIRLTVESVDGEEEDSQVIHIDTTKEPSCIDSHGHDWQRPLKVVGGIRESPGAWGHGGGVTVIEVCSKCGMYKKTDTWAQCESCGKQGLTKVTYREPDDVSMAWVEGFKR